MPPSAVILDDWRTLRRTTRPGAIRAHLADAMREEGLVKDDELFHDAFDYASAFHRAMTERDLREHTVEQVLSLALYTLGQPKPPTDPALGRATGRALDRNSEQVQWYEDAVPTLEELRGRGLPLALVTNTIFGLGRPWEERMSPYFPTRILSREYGFVKPHPGMFLEAARRLGANPKDCLFIGDLPLSDVWGAQQVGMKAVLLDRADDEQSTFRANDARLAANLGVDLRKIQPDHTVSSLADLRGLLG
ncbi:MAG: HAD family hydrolase [Thermoplasmata archaeon]